MDGQPSLYPRYLLPRLQEALSDSPVLLIQGSRQCGKSTLAQQLGNTDGYTYYSFDNELQRQAAQTDPLGFVTDLPERVILDEVQRVPELFTSLKLAVDNNRVPGRFILTGSANILLLPRLSDSLAGRMSILQLHPLAQSELARRQSSFLPLLFYGGFKTGNTGERLAQGLAQRIVAGGYPAALGRTNPNRRAAWHRDYANALVQRDIRDLSRINRLDVFPRLLQAVAGQTARLLKASTLAKPLQLSHPTARDYITFLQQIFVLEELPPWYSNRLSRLGKTPKLHIADTGLACALLGLKVGRLWQDRALYGQMLESFVYNELRKQASWLPEPVSFSHFRRNNVEEVDMVLECQGALAGIEVKASSTVVGSDFKSLRLLQSAVGSRFSAGVLLYDGEATLRFGPDLYAVPISCLWNSH